MGRADRRPRVSRLVQRENDRRRRLERQRDADARCALRRGGPAQRHAHLGVLPGLLSDGAVRRRVGGPQRGAGRRLVDGGQPDPAEGVPPRAARPLLPRLLPQVQRRAVSGGADPGQRALSFRPDAAGRTTAAVRGRGERRVEVPGLGRRRGAPEAAARQRGRPVGQREGQMEPDAPGRSGRHAHPARADPPRHVRRSRPGRVRRLRPGLDADARRPGAAPHARGRHDHPRRHGVRRADGAVRRPEGAPGRISSQRRRRGAVHAGVGGTVHRRQPGEPRPVCTRMG
jgi:hypothetical protein